MRKLNFGCGMKILPGFVNADIQKGDHVDLSFDFLTFPYPIDSNSFDYILIDNVLEHLPNPTNVLRELHRILADGGRVEIIVPYYNSYWAYSDPTHVNYFNEL